jgi:hypothetical protein
MAVRWIIDRMDVLPNHEGKTDVVYFVAWHTELTDGDYTVTSSGGLDIPYNVDAVFTPYANLAKSQVIGWVHAQLGEKGVQNIEKALSDQILALIGPSTVTKPNPW